MRGPYRVISSEKFRTARPRSAFPQDPPPW